MKGKRLANRSWEKQTYFKLENGFTVCVEWNQAYGNLVTHIEGNGEVWHGCNGIESLPECMQWAMEWWKPVAPGHWQMIMQPTIEQE